MKDVTLRESVVMPGRVPETMDEIAAELARAGGKIMTLDSEHVSFTGDRRPGSWRLLGGIGKGTVRRTGSGIEVVASFPAVYPIAAVLIVALVAALFFHIADWSIAVLMVALLPLFVTLVLKRRMKTIATRIIRSRGA
jgi:hypothetical protein